MYMDLEVADAVDLTGEPDLDAEDVSVEEAGIRRLTDICTTLMSMRRMVQTTDLDVIDMLESAVGMCAALAHPLPDGAKWVMSLNATAGKDILEREDVKSVTSVLWALFISRVVGGDKWSRSVRTWRRSDKSRHVCICHLLVEAAMRALLSRADEPEEADDPKEALTRALAERAQQENGTLVLSDMAELETRFETLERRLDDRIDARMSTFHASPVGKKTVATAVVNFLESPPGEAFMQLHLDRLRGTSESPSPKKKQK